MGRKSSTHEFGDDYNIPASTYMPTNNANRIAGQGRGHPAPYSRSKTFPCSLQLAPEKG